MSIDHTPHVRNLRGSEAGMPTFDTQGILLGKVTAIYGVDDPAITRIAELTRALVPADIAVRIQQEGGLEVNSDYFSGAYFVLPDQIDEVSGRGVFLNCHPNELVHVPSTL